MTIEEIINIIHKTIYQFFDVCGDNEEVPLSDKDKLLLSVNKAICNNIKALEQEPKIKVLNRDEAMRKLGAVDIYQARAWITLLDDLEYLGLKICEVEE